MWLKNIGRTEWKPNKHATICSAHFSPDSLDPRFGRVFLKRNAVPLVIEDNGRLLHTKDSKKMNIDVENRSRDIDCIPSANKSTYLLYLY